MQRKSIDQILDNHGQYASLNYYPTCDKSNLGLTFGLRGHTDPTIITMLLPDEVPGLEILQDDDWVPVKPIPNTLIVHVGDVLQVCIYFLSEILFVQRNKETWKNQRFDSDAIKHVHAGLNRLRGGLLSYVIYSN